MVNPKSYRNSGHPETDVPFFFAEIEVFQARLNLRFSILTIFEAQFTFFSTFKFYVYEKDKFTSCGIILLLFQFRAN